MKNYTIGRTFLFNHNNTVIKYAKTATMALDDAQPFCNATEQSSFDK